MFELVEYVDVLGRNHFRRWLNDQDRSVEFRVNTVIGRMQNGNFPNAKGVGGGVLEVRLHFGAGIRIYYGLLHDSVVLLLLGGTKQRQDADISLARKLLAESALLRKEE